MAYRLKRRKPIAEELSRVVAREFDKAIEQLSGGTPRAEAVHEVRKSVKKIRAVLRLLQNNLGKVYRTENRRLRTVGHQLSSLRDVDAMAETMKSVRDHYPRLLTLSTFAAVCRTLATLKRGTVRRLDPERLLARVGRELQQGAGLTTRRIRRVRGCAAIRAGIASGYRRTRKAMASVHASPEDMRFHTWRRRVKDHWYHMRLLESFNLTARARSRGLKRLETWLGDDHNLVLLRTTILSAPARFGRDRANALALGCIAKYQTTLRKRALSLGDRLFANSPKVFRKSVARCCHGRRAAS